MTAKRTIKRSDGTSQLTINGSPAYTYAGDSGPGQASGQGLNVYGGVWSVISPFGPWSRPTWGRVGQAEA